MEYYLYSLSKSLHPDSIYTPVLEYIFRNVTPYIPGIILEYEVEKNPLYLYRILLLGRPGGDMEPLYRPAGSRARYAFLATSGWF